MDYNIFSNIAPAMSKLSTGTEFVKFAISQVSKDMHEPLFRCSSRYSKWR